MLCATRPFVVSKSLVLGSLLLGTAGLAPFAGMPGRAPGVIVNAPELQKGAYGFIENRGQWDARAQFLSRSGGLDLWVTDRGVVYEFSKKEGDRLKGHVVGMEFVGGRPSSTRGDLELEGRLNYFIGNDSSKWASHVPRYAEVRSEQVYDGVAARWYIDQGRPRYDLVVAPGANPRQIAMRYEGAESIRVESNRLILGTSLGAVEHRGLFAYQRSNGAVRQVPCSMVAQGNVVRFEVGDYDRTRPLVIDPIIWSTFLGGSGQDFSFSVATDPSGAVYLTGQTVSADFPLTVGAFDTVFAGANELFASKISATGGTLVYSSYVGGSGSEQIGEQTIVDTAGRVLFAAGTNSSDFPTTAGAFDATSNGAQDGVLIRLAPDGAALTLSTYLGGSLNDRTRGVALGGDGSIFVCGETSSTDFPTTPDDFDVINNGTQDAFLSKLTPDGSGLVFSTYLGGATSDTAAAVHVNGAGEAFVAGTTNSDDFPVTPGAFDVVRESGEAFVTRFSALGTALVYSTLFGGTSAEFLTGLAINAANQAVIVGTNSGPIPLTPNAVDTTQVLGEGFVAVLSDTGTSLVYSSYLGGDSSDQANDVVFDPFGDIIAMGFTFSPNFPVTANAPFPGPGGGPGGLDAWVSKISLSTGFVYSSYFGGVGSDEGIGIASAPGGNVVFTGAAQTGYPITPGVLQPTATGSDSFATHLAIAPALQDAALQRNSVIGGFGIGLTITLNQPASVGDTLVSLATNNPGKVFLPATTKVRAGKPSKTLTVRTESVKVDTPVQITVSCNTVSKVLNLTLRPGGLQAVKASPTTLTSLDFGVGTVLLTAAAPTGGRIVSLESNNSPVLYVPTEVGVSEGKSEATFVMFACNVPATTSATVKAKLGTMTKTVTLTLNP